ncbi:putative Nuclear receptor coactivator 6 [Quillaja saponaria]|uniref:Nuclear receptor coactivator 6 n=1 Tax=Quillaja saponaria TaxID=32244 RepID=A0AAD7M2V8_QUISA|nr:putative Nuclear receptor coactivator 6 [Quillaja saponaria]
MIILFLLFLFIPYSASSPSLTHEIQPQHPYAKLHAANYHHYIVFYIKNTNPFFLNKQECIKKRKHVKNMNMKKSKKDYRAGPFSAMLPKGFVPPSGSSPCHNKNPKLVRIYCLLKVAEP